VTVTVAQFRQDFAEFKDATMFPTSMVQFWLDVAYLMLNAGRWGRMLDLGAELYTAHNCVMEARMLAEAANGAIPGANGSGLGVVNSKSVDKVSVGYDVSAAQNQLAGDYNLTLYGVRLWKFITLFGAGPVQVSAPLPAYSGGYSNTGGWSGPDCTPGFTNFGS